MTDLPPPPPPNMAPPPGYVSFGGSDAAARPIQRIGGLATALKVLLGLMIPVSTLSAVQNARLVQKARDFLAGQISKQEFNDAVGTSVAGLQLLLTIAIAVLTMIWMFRMASNLRTLGYHTTWASGWAIAGWFTPPLVGYVVPWLMFRELWRGSESERGADQHWKQRRVSPLLQIWWVLYGLVPVIGLQAIFRFYSASSSEDGLERDLAHDLDDVASVSMVTSIAAIAAAVVFLVIVRQLTARHMRATREA